jgi:hypothetical protein
MEKQMALNLNFDIRNSGGRSTGGGEYRDPAFMKNRSAPVHRWVPWIAGFSAQFVEDVFRECLPAKPRRRPVILDPFAGVGTTLVQAMLNGYHSVGFEINPYAALAARIKLMADSLELDALDALARQVERVPARGDGHPPLEQYRPPGFRSRIPFFSKQIEPQVLALLELLYAIPKRDLADVAKIAFGAVMVQVSNYTYEPSLGSRPGAGKPLLEYADVPAVLAAKLRQIRDDVLWLQQRSSRTPAGLRREIHCEDFLALDTEAKRGSVDLVVTSPPYMNNYHYVRNTRPQLFWLSLLTRSDDLRQLEQRNFGKYWQTVRDVDPIPLHSAHPPLMETLKTLRSTRTTLGAYGGPGWANYVASYFNDCDRFLAILGEVLHYRGTAIVVIGNSIIQGIHIPTDQILGELAEARGLRLEKIVVLRAKRVGTSIISSSVRRGKRNGTRLYESAVVLRRR